MCKWLLKCASPGLWFLFSGSSTALPWQPPLQISHQGGLVGGRWLEGGAEKQVESWALDLYVPVLVCGCSSGPVPPTARLPHFIPQRISFAGNGFRGWEWFPLLRRSAWSAHSPWLLLFAPPSVLPMVSWPPLSAYWFLYLVLVLFFP